MNLVFFFDWSDGAALGSNETAQQKLKYATFEAGYVNFWWAKKYLNFFWNIFIKNLNDILDLDKVIFLKHNWKVV